MRRVVSAGVADHQAALLPVFALLSRHPVCGTSACATRPGAIRNRLVDRGKGVERFEPRRCRERQEKHWVDRLAVDSFKLDRLFAAGDERPTHLAEARVWDERASTDPG